MMLVVEPKGFKIPVVGLGTSTGSTAMNRNGRPRKHGQPGL